MEISEKTAVSPKTISKIRRFLKIKQSSIVKGNGVLGDVDSRIIFELVKSVYDVYFILTLSLLIDEENVRDLIRTYSKDFTSTLAD